MTADIIQFVPKANPDRPTLVEAYERKGEEFLERAPALAIDPTPSQFVAPEKDPA